MGKVEDIGRRGPQYSSVLRDPFAFLCEPLDSRIRCSIKVRGQIPNTNMEIVKSPPTRSCFLYLVYVLSPFLGLKAWPFKGYDPNEILAAV